MANELKVKDLGQVAITNMLNQVVSYANMESVELTTKEKQYAVGIITRINQKVIADNLSWGQLDIQGCQLPQQIKNYCRLGLTFENSEIWLDVRNNGKTGKKDINIKPQYQGLKRILVKYCEKEIVRFAESEICKGDTIKEKMNLSKGCKEISEHEYYETEDIDYRNKLSNIIGAYAIAYVKEDGELVPYVARIDKNRIERARNSATTKNIWDKDTKKMVIKTAYWELYNVLKPFINMPQDLLKDFEEVSSREVDFNNGDFINANIEEVNECVSSNVASEGVKNIDPIVDDNGVVEETPTPTQEDIFRKHMDNIYD